MMGQRTHTPWRVTILIVAQVNAALVKSGPYHNQYIQAALKALCERSRKRPLQSLPPTIIQMIKICRQLGVSDV